MSPSLRLETEQPFPFRRGSSEKPLLDVAAGAGKEHLILSHVFQGLRRPDITSTCLLRSQPGNSGYPLGVLRRISCSCPMSGEAWEQPASISSRAGDVAGPPATFSSFGRESDVLSRAGRFALQSAHVRPGETG